MLQLLHQCELGRIPYSQLQSREILRRSLSLQLSQLKEIKTLDSTSILCLDFDKADERFLISGDLNSSISIYDTLDTTDLGRKISLDPSVTISKSNCPNSHRYGVTTISWYPHDTGLFISGSYDRLVKIWDPNELLVVHEFQFSTPIQSSAMSPLLAHHQLVAVGTNDPKCFMCDLRISRCAQVLSIVPGSAQSSLNSPSFESNPSTGILSIAWSLTHEHQLVTALGDGTMRMWDIRNPICFLAFDLHFHWADLETQSPRIFRVSDSKTNSPLAHHGTISSIRFVPNKPHLLSTATDGMMRLWDVDYGCNLLVHYPGIQNPLQDLVSIALSRDGRLVFHPNGKSLDIFDIQSAAKMGTLSGHYNSIKTCIQHSSREDVYSAGRDGQILLWTPSMDEKPSASISKPSWTSETHSIDSSSLYPDELDADNKEAIIEHWFDPSTDDE